MRKLEYEKFKEHILGYMTKEELKEEVEHYKKDLYECGGTIFGAASTMCQYGCFDVYYEDCFETLKDIYGDDFNESIYKTKDGDWRWKNNETYCWTVYKAKIARTIYEMYKKGEL